MAADQELIFHRLSQAGRLVPITSTFPSTTNNVLSTLWTGYSPAAHGILAYEVYLRELGVAASTLFFWPIHHRRNDALAEWGIDAKTFVPVPHIAEQLIAQGITTRSFISKNYAHSLLTRTLSRGVREVHPFVSGGDLWVGLQRTLERHADDKLFLSAYWDTIDGITHQCGPDDEAWNAELRGFSWMLKREFLARLTPEQRDGTLLLLVADHGGITTLARSAIQVDKHPTLRDALSLPPLGENRAPFLYTRGDTIAQVRSYMQKQLHKAFVTLTREQVLTSGLLGPGPIYDETPHRLGDLIGIARGRHYMARNQNQLKMRGRHGGLSAEEMLIPLLGVRLDAL